ncbi:hypothetical protein H2204_001355 [Knufia peltigerae]|uniref:FAD-binding domain-containing protein n=1 Tax=Knufia peltigerae TaxID=1002370 RepID=A0AA39D3Z6_9EURO|nr:hypothetical protein H2204_001355 [Knufia peltigerae]
MTWATFERRVRIGGAREPDSLGLLDGQTGHAFAKLGGVPYGQPGFFLRANRDLLRGHLARHLEVATDKRLLSYTEDSTGVTGADGAYSVVRGQLLGPNAMPQLSQNIPTNGECTLVRSEYEPLRRPGNSVLSAALPGVFFNIGLVSVEPDRSKGEFYWGVAFQSDNPTRDSNWAAEADRQTLYDKCVELTRDMPAWLTSIIHKTGPGGMNMPCIKFVEYVPPETLPKGGRVTYMGDAAHTTIPFKGDGANTAVTDSCDLGRLIVRAFEDDDGPGWTGIAGVLDEYNSSRCHGDVRLCSVAERQHHRYDRWEGH